jgi:hypothetical protein
MPSSRSSAEARILTLIEVARVCVNHIAPFTGRLTMLLCSTCLRRFIAPTVLAVATLGLFAEAASAACPTATASQPFARWGDRADYALAPGGSFEGTLSWAATGSPSLFAENDPFGLAGPGTTSVALTGRQSITSPVVCVSGSHPYLRFVARARDRTSRLVLELLWSDQGVYKEKVLEEHPADLWRRWAPSKIVPLAGALPVDSGEVHEVRLRFKLKDGAGDWLVDDLFVDPVKRG